MAHCARIWLELAGSRPGQEVMNGRIQACQPADRVLTTERGVSICTSAEAGRGTEAS